MYYKAVGEIKLVNEQFFSNFVLQAFSPGRDLSFNSIGTIFVINSVFLTVLPCSC